MKDTGAADPERRRPEAWKCSSKCAGRLRASGRGIVMLAACTAVGCTGVTARAVVYEGRRLALSGFRRRVPGGRAYPAAARTSSSTGSPGPFPSPATFDIPALSRTVSASAVGVGNAMFGNTCATQGGTAQGAGSTVAGSGVGAVTRHSCRWVWRATSTATGALSASRPLTDGCGGCCSARRHGRGWRRGVGGVAPTGPAGRPAQRRGSIRRVPSVPGRWWWPGRGWASAGVRGARWRSGRRPGAVRRRRRHST